MLKDSSSFFFFSSRRRHTRFDCDWSSDVCSSDLCDRAWTRHLRPARKSHVTAHPKILGSRKSNGRRSPEQAPRSRLRSRGPPSDENFTWVAEKFLWRLARLGGMVDFRYASRPRSWPAHVLCN